MRRFWAALLVIVLVVSTGFGRGAPEHVGAPDMRDAAVSHALVLDRSGGLEGCCASDVAHLSDGGQCSIHCTPALWHVSTAETAATVLAFGAPFDAHAETSAPLTPFRPPVA